MDYYSGGSQGYSLCGGKGRGQGMGDVCFQMDEAAWTALSAFAPVLGKKRPERMGCGGGVPRRLHSSDLPPYGRWVTKESLLCKRRKEGKTFLVLAQSD